MKGFLALYVGLIVLFLLFVLISLAPQVSRKFGDLVKRKEQQKSYAQTALAGTAWTSVPSTSSPVSKSASAQPQGLATYTVDQEVIDEVNLINNYRSQNSLATLVTDKMLTDAAKWMSNDMASKNYFSHTDSLGRNPFVRMASFGYNFNTWKGENLAAGASDAQTIFNLWQSSPGHNAILLDPNYTAIGLYRAYNPDSGYGWYWTADFGGEIDEQVNYVTAPPPKTPPCNSPFSLGVGTGGYGDVDGDGMVSKTDSDWIFQKVDGSRILTQAQIEAADVDGLPNVLSSAINVDSADATNILQYLDSSISFPVCVDHDSDGFVDGVENYIGTNPTVKCGPDAWPPDINNDGKVTLADALAFNPVFRSANGDPMYNRRFDLNADGKITLADVLMLNKDFGKSCK